MKDNIKYWSAMGVGKQMAFKEDGSTYETEVLMPIGEQHILYNGMLMCGKPRDAKKGKMKGKKQKTVLLRIEGLPLCKECKKKYKANSNMMYHKWVEASTGLHGVT